jgi:hypothetical protein
MSFDSRNITSLSMSQRRWETDSKCQEGELDIEVKFGVYFEKTSVLGLRYLL